MIKNYIENLKFFLFSDNKFSKYSILLSVMIIFAALLELIAISLLAIFFLVITNQNLSEVNNIFINYSFIDFQKINFFFLIIGFFFIKNLYIVVLEYIKSKTLSRLFLKFQKKNINNFINIDYLFYKSIKGSIFSKNVNFSTERTFVGMGESFFSLINEFFIFFSILTFLSISLSFHILIGGFFIVIIYLLIFKKIKQLTTIIGNQFNYSASNIFSISEGIFKGFKEIRIYNKEIKFIKFFEDSVVPFAKAWMSSRFILNILKHVNETIIIFLVLSSLIILKYLDIPINNINFSFAAFAISTIRLYPNLSKIQNTLTLINITLPISNELKKFYKNLARENNLNLNNNNLYKKDINLKNNKFSLKIADINFKYGKKEILNNINIKFENDKKYFIFGPSGCGKTTLLEIICGILKPSEGNLKINDGFNDYVLLNNSELISYVPQDSYMIDSSIYNNISLFDEKNAENIKKAEQAIKDCSLNYDIDLNKNGLDTLIGDNGARLSSGQKQRLSLARAMYKNRPIIVLDEPTSNLDKKTEDHFMSNLFKNCKNKILIFVSHNLNFYEKFDKIYLIKNGNLQETENANLIKLKNLL
tara:strand:- start:5258 stop:7027 length:1770 start_codon:yes stop_codon:yes gene_type:complete